jgi:hypothetical protein
MRNPENSSSQEILRQEFETWQNRYFQAVYSLFEKGDRQGLVIALEIWEAGFVAFLRDKFPRLVTMYETQTTPSIPLTQAGDPIINFKPNKSDQIEAFLKQCIENASKGTLEVTSLTTTEQTQAVKVFICYSHHDKTFAKKLAGELEGAGMQVWWDFDNLKGGDDWQKEIEIGIKQCEYFLVALTPEAVASEWVGNEITYASNAQKTIIPLHLKKCDIPISLIKKQYIDFEKQTQKAAIKELIGILKAPSVVE